MSRSKVKVTRDKKTPITPSANEWSVLLHDALRARCKQRHAAADGTIPSLPGAGDFGGLRPVSVW